MLKPLTKSLKLISLTLVFLGLMAVAVLGIRNYSKPSNSITEERRSSDNRSLKPTPADSRISAAESVIKRAPTIPEGYNLLAAAYMSKARETEDFAVNLQAQEALARSNQVAPGNYDALKLGAKLFLVFHRFEEALSLARQAQGVNPLDHDNYGAITDALVELGEYPLAVEAAQRMVDLRPDTSSYARVSYLRWLHGDNKGAIEAMRMAAQSANPQDRERVAWCHVQLGDALLNSGNRTVAEREYDRALFVFPGYGMALDAKARARIAAGDFKGAIEIYDKEQKRSISADTALALGDLYARLGDISQANRNYETFESLERENASAENDMHHLIKYWTDHNRNIDEALAAARKERERRNDIYTCDALAWALYKKGEFAEAKKMMNEAMRLGTRDPRLLYHYGMIAHALGEKADAAKYLREALAINADFDVLQAEVARRTLSARLR